MSLTDYNRKKGAVDWGIDTSNWEYHKLSEFPENMEFQLNGVFITPDHGFGMGAVIISDGVLINVPNRYVDTFRDIMADATAIEQIKSGKATFSYEKVLAKKYKRYTCVLTFKVE